MPQSLKLKKLKLNGSLKTCKPSRTNTKKRCSFHHGDWNAKVGSQEIHGVTGKFGLVVRNEAGQMLTEICKENILVIANTLFLQHKRLLYTWTLPNGQYWNEFHHILCSWRWRSSTQLAKTIPELTVAQISSVQSISHIWLCDLMDCSTPGLPVY